MTSLPPSLVARARAAQRAPFKIGGRGRRGALVHAVASRQPDIGEHQGKPLLRYHREVWMANDPRSATPQVIRVPELRRLMADVLAAYPEDASWRSSFRGALCGAVWVVQLLGWAFHQPFVVIDETGHSWTLTPVAPRALEKRWKEALQRCEVALSVSPSPHRLLVTPTATSTSEKGVWVAPRRKAWRTLRDPIEKAKLLSATSGGRQTAERLHAAGKHPDGKCTCGTDDSAFHAAWECPLTRGPRLELPSEVVPTALAVGPSPETTRG